MLNLLYGIRYGSGVIVIIINLVIITFTPLPYLTIYVMQIMWAGSSAVSQCSSPQSATMRNHALPPAPTAAPVLLCSCAPTIPVPCNLGWVGFLGFLALSSPWLLFLPLCALCSVQANSIVHSRAADIAAALPSTITLAKWAWPCLRGVTQCSRLCVDIHN